MGTPITKLLVIIGCVFLALGGIGMCGETAEGMIEAISLSIQCLFDLNIIGAIGTLFAVCTNELMLLGILSIVLAIGNGIFSMECFDTGIESKYHPNKISMVKVLVIAVVGEVILLTNMNLLLNNLMNHLDILFFNNALDYTSKFQKILTYVCVPVSIGAIFEFQWVMIAHAIKSSVARAITMTITFPVYFIIAMIVGFSISGLISAIVSFCIVAAIMLFIVIKVVDLSGVVVAAHESDEIMAGRKAMSEASDEALDYLRRDSFNPNYVAKVNADLELKSRGNED